jgi:hypothetical protein
MSLFFFFPTEVSYFYVLPKLDNQGSDTEKKLMRREESKRVEKGFYVHPTLGATELYIAVPFALSLYITWGNQAEVG